jgi:molybdate transport system regulatory protein
MRFVPKDSRTSAIRLRIDLDPNTSVGPGKIALLERIEATGSLSQAARELGISYRRAWLLLDDLNHAFVEPATTTSVGGTGGGGAQLTPFGKALIAAYREIERETEKATRSRLSWLSACVKSAKDVTATKRRALTKRVGDPAAKPVMQASPRTRAAKRP